jgi:hypothetical protein
MNFVNRVKVERRKDHYLLWFGFSGSDDPNDRGAEQATVAIPLGVATELLLELFKGSMMAPVEVQELFADYNLRLADTHQVALEAGERSKALQLRQLAFAQQQQAKILLQAAQAAHAVQAAQVAHAAHAAALQQKEPEK